MLYLEHPLQSDGSMTGGLQGDILGVVGVNLFHLNLHGIAHCRFGEHLLDGRGLNHGGESQATELECVCRRMIDQVLHHLVLERHALTVVRLTGGR